MSSWELQLPAILLLFPSVLYFAFPPHVHRRNILLFSTFHPSIRFPAGINVTVAFFFLFSSSSSSSSTSFTSSYSSLRHYFYCKVKMIRVDLSSRYCVTDYLDVTPSRYRNLSLFSYLSHPYLVFLSVCRDTWVTNKQNWNLWYGAKRFFLILTDSTEHWSKILKYWTKIMMWFVWIACYDLLGF